MATEEVLQCISVPANADLSTKQYYFMVVNSSGNAATAGAGTAMGVLQNAPAAAGRAATLAIGGRTKVVLGGTVAIGDRVTSDSSGKCVAVTSGEIELGFAVEGGASGVIGSIVLQRGASIA